LQSDADIAAGDSARGIGRYDLAVDAYAKAQAIPDAAAAATHRMFEALREVDIAHHLVGRMTRRLRMPRSSYRGFDLIDPPLDATTVRRRLDDLARTAAAKPGGGNYAAQNHADFLERGQGRAGEAAPAPADTDVPLRLALAHDLLRDGALEEMRQLLAPLERNAIPLPRRETLLARAQLREGRQRDAAMGFSLALLYLDGVGSGSPLHFQRVYKNHRVIHFMGEFYAIPESYDPIALDISLGHERIVVHRLPRGLRATLARLLPARVTQLLRWFLGRLHLWRRLPLERMKRSTDLLSVMRGLDDGKR